MIPISDLLYSLFPYTCSLGSFLKIKGFIYVCLFKSRFSSIIFNYLYIWFLFINLQTDQQRAQKEFVIQPDLLAFVYWSHIDKPSNFTILCSTCFFLKLYFCCSRNVFYHHKEVSSQHDLWRNSAWGMEVTCDTTDLRPRDFFNPHAWILRCLVHLY